ncbi:unnamed protein product [Trichogramma brassicae]|uniref:Uncharacterized protein n=1 Tax=Trichogramma brassicae TaxID=86971 RepID=A0A6H5IMU5_9HYME|nr:unnamed protein product [Trichogramma brassicae]
MYFPNPGSGLSKIYLIKSFISSINLETRDSIFLKKGVRQDDRLCSVVKKRIISSTTMSSREECLSTNVAKITNATNARRNLDKNHICSYTKKQSTKVAKITNATSAKENFTMTICLS